MSKVIASGKPFAAAAAARGQHAAGRARQQQRGRALGGRLGTGTSPPADVITSTSSASAASRAR